MSRFHRSAGAPLTQEGALPSLEGATGWLNSEPLSLESLQGKVVVVQFWTYTCINWLRTAPYVRAWAERYREEAVVIGVHTPEFSFEHDRDNVERAAAAMGIDYPIALDSDYAVWRAFRNNYWPALYVAGADGEIRYHHFGEGAYEESEAAIQQLLVVAGQAIAGGSSPVTPTGIEAPADWESLKTPETYIGYEQAEGFSSPGGAVSNRRHVYTAPSSLSRNHWALEGDWTIGGEPATLNEAGGSLVHRFQARDVNLVMGPQTRGAAVRFQVRIDGDPPGEAQGVDIDERGDGVLDEQRLYQLVRQGGAIRERSFEVTFLDPGPQAYVLTFG